MEKYEKWKNYTKPETNIERNILSDLLMIYDDINKTSFCNKNVAHLLFLTTVYVSVQYWVHLLSQVNA